jgi:rhodanese-related sulfurtransferase
MRTLVFVAAALLASGALAGSLGCSNGSNDQPAQRGADPSSIAKVPAADPVPTISVDELDQMLASQAAVPVDANGEPVRKKMGVIPGAVLLSDYETFLPSELPADKSRPLVFYCANAHCGASHEAADRARLAGYQDVRVLPDGIAGWVKAGKQVQSI